MEKIHYFFPYVSVLPNALPTKANSRAFEEIRHLKLKTIFCVKGKQEIQMFENYFCLTLI